jgi:hypothetical protein
MRIVVTLFLLTLISCQQLESTTEKEKPLTPLSNWLVANEDSLFFYFIQKVKKSALNEALANETLVSREFQIEEGFIGQLTKKIHDFDSCIQVYYLYKPEDQPSFQLLLSPDYNKKCVPAVDRIFNDIDSLKHFRIVKYKPAEGLFSAFIVEKDTVRPEDLKFKPVQKKELYDLDVFVTKNLSGLTKETLLSSILGEEVQLKKVNTIRFIVSPDSLNGSMRLADIRRFFKVKG